MIGWTKCKPGSHGAPAPRNCTLEMSCYWLNVIGLPARKQPVYLVKIAKMWPAFIAVWMGLFVAMYLKGLMSPGRDTQSASSNKILTKLILSLVPEILYADPQHTRINESEECPCLIFEERNKLFQGYVKERDHPKEVLKAVHGRSAYLKRKEA